jgi:hypothetical protein
MSSHIPENAAESFDEKLLLDQIFGSSTALPVSKESAVLKERLVSDDVFLKAPLVSDDPALLKAPLVSDRSALYRSALLSVAAAYYAAGPIQPPDTSAARNSLQWLRGQEVAERRHPWYGELFKEALLSKESRYWLAFILILAAILTINNSMVGKQNNALKHHNWLTIQKASLPSSALRPQA